MAGAFPKRSPGTPFAPYTPLRRPPACTGILSRPTTEPTYRAGDRVRHPSFGVGIVISVRADPSSEIVEVNFAGPAGVKKLDTAFAPLTRA